MKTQSKNKVLSIIENTIIMLIVIISSHFMINNFVFMIKMDNYEKTHIFKGNRISKDLENKIEKVLNMESNIYSEEDLKLIKDNYKDILTMLKKDKYVVQGDILSKDSISALTFYESRILNTIIYYSDYSDLTKKLMISIQENLYTSSLENATFSYSGVSVLLGTDSVKSQISMEDEIINNNINICEMITDLILEIGGVDYE